ncbi:MAG: hypothetical protein K0Q55_2256 [Verrucomicrobia bacterium]|nr:hypothetical protein [Verrucomicrobiota bacterium]
MGNIEYRAMGRVFLPIAFPLAYSGTGCYNVRPCIV